MQGTADKKRGWQKLSEGGGAGGGRGKGAEANEMLPPPLARRNPLAPLTASPPWQRGPCWHESKEER